ncbi:MAG: GIY-YIG nuclease family protein, partial [Deltaproteobacteria bacterium]|nr:GIY-YIG nuclease family protein [Deltaproteobacteria bacterium]MBW2531249.1 GIY-YIG nuclease family protein [Deltaproteobacteria bacterium]
MFSSTCGGPQVDGASEGLGLAELPVLLIDCQATGASPEHGALLEVGWQRWEPARSSARPRTEVRARVVALPPDRELPPRIARLTGIGPSELATAVPARQAYRELRCAAGALAGQLGLERAPAVIHFARYEERFLRALHQQHDGSAPFPLQLLCAHRIAARLLPELPRRSLRALAGYFGHPLGRERRSAVHVRATGVVWRALVARLTAEREVTTLAQLERWLAESRPIPKAARVYAMPRERRLRLPDEPGVYQLLGPGREVLYVGKATLLRSRVNGHFRRRTGGPDRSLELLTQVRDVAVTATKTALEAALLETDEIKRLDPPYNVALR